MHHVKIADLVPTILHLMGLPVRADLDVEVPLHVFGSDSGAAETEVRTAEGAGSGVGAQRTGSVEGVEEVRDRLWSLGYLT